MFVANRVSMIRQHTNPGQWNHVSGAQNPADVALRGCKVTDIPDSWFEGPPFLNHLVGGYGPPPGEGVGTLHLSRYAVGVTQPAVRFSVVRYREIQIVSIINLKA